MVLGFEISHPVKRRCMICNEIKIIPLNVRPICKDCLRSRKNRILYYEKLVLFILLILLLVTIISL